MSVPSEPLATFSTDDGATYRIELTADQQVHLQADKVRIELDVEQFIPLAKTVIEAQKTLDMYKS